MFKVKLVCFPHLCMDAAYMFILSSFRWREGWMDSKSSPIDN